MACLLQIKYSFGGKFKMSEDNNYPVYIPDIVSVQNDELIENFKSFFSYEIINFIPNKRSITHIKRIIELNKCPRDHKLFFVNCFNRTDNYKITIIRVCHHCNRIWFISGRYSTNNKFLKAFNFFNMILNNNTNKRR